MESRSTGGPTIPKTIPLRIFPPRSTFAERKETCHGPPSATPEGRGVGEFLAYVGPLHIIVGWEA